MTRIVIIGAGLKGAAVVALLAEDPTCRPLVLEANMQLLGGPSPTMEGWAKVASRRMRTESRGRLNAS
jgi:2-polyprenyl-6-methoxyphenol hydroxylase-like FAD-dependent oxidoreductase